MFTPRTLIIAVTALVAVALTIEFLPPSFFDMISSASAKGKGKGNGNGNGNGGGNGNGPGNGNGNAYGHQKGGDSNPGIGNGFESEGFASRGNGAAESRLQELRKSGFIEDFHKSEWEEELRFESGSGNELEENLSIDANPSEKFSKFLSIDDIDVNLPRGNSDDAEAAEGSNVTSLPPGLAKKDGAPPGLAASGGVPPGLADSGGIPPGLAAKGGIPPGLADTGGIPPGLVDKGGLPPGQAKKLENVADDLQSADAVAADEQNFADNNDLILKPGSYIEDEILALALSDMADRRAQDLGFGLSASSFVHNGKTLVTLKVPPGMDAPRALALLRRELPGQAFYLNHLYRPYLPADKEPPLKQQPEDRTPDNGNSVCLDERCYGKKLVGWKEQLSLCGSNVSIGVIDTDVDLQHPTFSGQNIKHKSFVTRERPISPDWHGTGVLALLAGRPDSNTPGLLPHAHFSIASVFFTNKLGEAVTDTVTLLSALDWMSDSNVRLVNMSFSGPKDDLVQARIKDMREKGFIFTAAAGNEGPVGLPSYPAAYSEVVAVTAITKNLEIYPYASRGNHVDLAAPGVHIWTASPGGGEDYRTGTSFAAPYVTAILALQPAEIFNLSEAEFLDHLKTVSIRQRQQDPIFGRGLLKAPAECPAPMTSSVSDWKAVATPSAFSR